MIPVARVLEVRPSKKPTAAGLVIVECPVCVTRRGKPSQHIHGLPRNADGSFYEGGVVEAHCIAEDLPPGAPRQYEIGPLPAPYGRSAA